MTRQFHPGAELDIAEPLDFFAAQAGPLVAQRFLADPERVVSCNTVISRRMALGIGGELIPVAGQSR